MNEKLRAKGTVGYSGSNVFKGKKLFSFSLKGEDGFFGCGISDPKVKSGDMIEFDYEVVNGRASVILDSINVLSLAADNRNSGSPGGNNYSNKSDGRTGSDAGKDGYWRDKADRDLENDQYRRENDLRIQYQSARNAAIEWIRVLLSAPNILVIPEKKGAGKEVLEGLLEDKTNEFFHKTSAVGIQEEENA